MHLTAIKCAQKFCSRWNVNFSKEAAFVTADRAFAYTGMLGLYVHSLGNYGIVTMRARWRRIGAGPGAIKVDVADEVPRKID